MAIDLSKEQTQAWDYLMDFSTNPDKTKEVRRILYGGQAGGGKSFLISLWTLHMHMKYPGTRSYIAREVLKDAKGSILVTLLDVARLTGVMNVMKYNDQKGEVLFANGSVIKLLEVAYKPSDPNYESLGSTEYTFGSVEEGGNIHERAADLLLSRTRYKHDIYDLKPKQLITCNPADSWIKDQIVVPYYEGNLRGDSRFVRATLESNPNKKFVDGYKSTLESMNNEYDKARLLHGDWFAVQQTGGEFYKDFDKIKHVDQQAKYNPDLPIHISFDENVNPYITCLVAQIVGKQITIIDEICLPNPRNTLKSLCQEFSNRYFSHISGVFIYGDATSKKEDVKLEKGYNFYSLIRQYLQKFRPVMRVPRRNPSIIMRGNFINTILRTGFKEIELKISYLCNNTVRDLQMVKESPDGKKDKKKTKDAYTGVAYEKYGHCSDALDYIICEAFAEEFINFQQGDDPIKSFFVKERRKLNY